MCGINGIVRLRPDAAAIDGDELLRTREAMTARGPDAAGAWISPDGRAALASRRLAILDLSSAGEQPMASPDGRWHLVMNGEIYNFRALRRELEGEGAVFRSQSDTEVVLELLARRGSAGLGRLRGMFGLALWDAAGKRLLLARDPLGIKPLYYSTDGGCLRFASQVKALEAGGAVSRAVDPAGLAGFLLWGAVPDPFTIRRDVHALPAGCFLVVEDSEDGRIGEPERFDRFDGLNGETAGEPLRPLSPALAVEDSVAAHLVSDVPVAVFLSAGLDSGMIAALARRRLADPPVTFTLTFDVLAGTPGDEGPLAAEVARSLGTRHVERRVGRADFAGLWPAALAAMDQPSIDGFNTFVVSKAAHEAGLKVVLSGLGGDEAFGSYPSFRDVPALARTARRLGRLPGLAPVWPGLARFAAADRPKLSGLVRYGGSTAGAYLLRRGLFLPDELPALLGREMAEEGLRRYDPLRAADGVLQDLPGRNGDDPWRDVHRLETSLYMRHQLLRDSDWASMAWSVELRVPLADAWLYRHLAAAGFEPARSRGKAALVREAAPELPAALFERPKTGFYIPVLEWLDPESARLRPGSRSRHLALRVLAETGTWSRPD